MIDQDENTLKLFISRHQQDIFALALYLVGGDRDKAYDITVSSFVKAAPFPEQGDAFLVNLARATIEECRNIKVIPFSKDPGSTNLSPGEKESLRIVRAGLQLLPFDVKVLVLLRGQMHLSYKDISIVLGTSKHVAKIQTIQAHSQFREKITDVINHEQ